MASDSAGTTITFGTSGFSSNVLSVTGPSISRAAIPSTHLGTTIAHTKIAAELYEAGELSMVVDYDGSEDPPIDGPIETITINPGGEGNSVVFLGFCSGWEPDIPESGGRMTASLTVTCTGTVSPIT